MYYSFFFKIIPLFKHVCASCNSVCFKHDYREVFKTKVNFFFTIEHVHIIMWNLGIAIVTNIFVAPTLQEFDS